MVYNVQCTFIAFIKVHGIGPKFVYSGSIFNLWNQMKKVFTRKPEFFPNKIPDSCWLLSASGHLVSLSCSQSLNWNYWLTRIKEQRLILFQILKNYWNDFPLYNIELKIFECGDQIIPIPNQRNNCNVCLRLRKEIPINSAKIARICSTPNWNFESASKFWKCIEIFKHLTLHIHFRGWGGSSQKQN